MNQFVNLPVPAGNGIGASVDVSSFGAIKTIVCGGTAESTLNIEVNNDAAQAGGWQTVATFQNRGQLTIKVAARWMRVRVTNFNPYVGGTSQVDVGGTDGGATFASLAVPVGNGAGAQTDVSALGLFKSVQVAAPFRGSVIIEVSEDGLTEWGQVMAFQTPGIQSQIIAAKFMRVVRVGVPVISAGLPVVNVGATDDVSGDDGVAISAGTQSVATGTVAFANSNGVSFGMSGSSRVTASFDGIRSISGGTTNALGPGVSFADGNGVSFGITGSTVTASVGAGALGGIAAGTQTASSGTVAFANSNGMTFGMSNSNQITGSFSTLSFSNSNGVSFGIAGSTLTASVQSQSTAPGAIAAGTQTATSGTVLFSNSNGITFGMSGNSRVTANYASYLSAYGINTNELAFQLNQNAVEYIIPAAIPAYMSVTQEIMLVNLAVNSGSTGAETVSLGVYTVSGSIASLASSTSRVMSWTSGNNTANTGEAFGASGTRWRTIGGNFSMTPGFYMFGFWARSTNDGTFSVAGVANVSIVGSYDGVESGASAAWLPGALNNISSFTTAMIGSFNVTDANYLRSGSRLYQPLFSLMATS